MIYHDPKNHDSTRTKGVSENGTFNGNEIVANTSGSVSIELFCTTSAR